jgi:hypothetical protein
VDRAADDDQPSRVTTVRKLKASLGFKRVTVPRVLVRGRIILAKMSRRPAWYGAASGLLAILKVELQQLDDAQQATLRGPRGMTGARDRKCANVMTTLSLLRTMVQSFAADSPELAAALIQEAGMKIAAPPAHQKAALKARLGPGGSVLLMAHAGLLAPGLKRRRRTFNWQYRELGAPTWITATPGAVAKTRIDGLVPLVRYEFRVMVSSKDGPGAWSQAVRILLM